MKKVVILVTLVVTGLAFLQIIPEFSIGSFSYKPVDLFSDLRPTSDDMGEGGFLSAASNEWPEGVVPFDDFSAQGPDSVRPHGMDKFYGKLAQRDRLPRPVRIAFYGDSFIENDMLTADLRTQLQALYGGHGIGFVDIDNATSENKTFVKTNNVGFECKNLIEDGFKHSMQGISHHYAEAWGNAYIDVTVTDTCDVSYLFYHDASGISTQASVNGSAVSAKHSVHDKMAVDEVSGRIRNMKWQISCSKALVYGTAFDSRKGVIVDNFGLKSNSGYYLKNIPMEILRSFADVRPYDMILICYGLNVVSAKQTTYTKFCDYLGQAIENFGAAFPDATIVVVGLPDRGTKKNGAVVSMGGIPEMSAQQREVAQKHRCVFWSLRDAQKALGGMEAMGNANPALINKDYTHITHAGGKALAQCLTDAIDAGFKIYQKKKKK